MIPGAGPELLFRSFALATARWRADARRARRDRRDRACPSGAAGSRSTAPRGFDAAAAEEAPEGPFRDLARTLARGSADVTPLAALAAAIRELVPHGGRVAVESAGLASGELDELRALLPGIELGDGSVLLRLIRMVKTRRRDRALPAAAEIAEGALARDGRRGCARPHAGRARAGLPPRRRRARSGSRARRDQPVRARHRHRLRLSRARARRAAARRRLSLPLVRLGHGHHARARAARGRGRRALRPRPRLPRGGRGARSAPGTPVSAVYRAMREVADGTLAERAAPQGHGLGLEPRELPFIGPPTELRLADDVVDLAVDQSLEPGMVDQPRGATGDAGHYAVHVERTFLITAGGVEPITAQDRSAARAEHGPLRPPTG